MIITKTRIAKTVQKNTWRFALSNVLLSLIKFYQRFISPLKRPSCRFYPSCSAYALLAIKKYGAAKGMVKTVWRILRCNPFNDGGVDFP